MALKYPSLPHKLYSKALIKVGYACNSACLFCHVEHYRGTPKSETARVLHKIAQVKLRGFDMVALSGGEVTIRSDFPTFVKAAEHHELLLGLVSNGRKAASKAWVRNLHKSGLRYAYISFYGATADIHNFLAGGVDCFEEQCAGVRNLAGFPDIDLTLNVIMCQQNLGQLRQIVDLFAGVPHLRIKFSALEVKGAGEDNFELIAPPVTEAAEAALDAIAYGEEVAAKRENLIFGIDGLPPCLVGEDFHARYNDNLMTHGIFYMTETWEDRFYHVDDLNKRHMLECLDCDLAHRCPGISAGYERTEQGEGLKPFRSVKSNSFNYELVEDLGAVNGGCPMREGKLPLLVDPMEVLVKTDGRLWRAATDTGDYSEPDIAWVKRATGQLYLDVSDKALPDDFPNDFRKLTLAGECRSCQHEAVCCLMFEPYEGNVFRAGESAIEELFRGISGRILDVGCGSVLYRGLFEELIRSGQWQYEAVEPFPPLGLREEIEGWGGRLHVQPFEEFHGREAAYDAIFFLRSWNHLNDAPAAARKVLWFLKPEGSVYLAENTSFALVRTSGQVAAAKALDALPFEHFRNHTSQQAFAILERAGLGIERHVPVGPETANQWLLAAKKPAEIRNLERVHLQAPVGRA